MAAKIKMSRLRDFASLVMVYGFIEELEDVEYARQLYVWRCDLHDFRQH